MNSIRTSIFQSIVTPATKRCTGAVIFLHGSGADGPDIKMGAEESMGAKFEFPHLKVIYPTAPVMNYSLNGGFPGNVWFDRTSLHITAKEDLKSINAMCGKMDQFIDEIIDTGIDPKNIIFGGFSMVGCLALHYGLRWRKDLKGIFSLSSFISNKSQVYQDIKNSSTPPLFMACGTEDHIIDYDWSERTHQELVKLGVESSFLRLPGLIHSTDKEEILALRKFILQLLPENETS